jgi:hypothetical protein
LPTVSNQVAGLFGPDEKLPVAVLKLVKPGGSN